MVLGGLADAMSESTHPANLQGDSLLGIDELAPASQQGLAYLSNNRGQASRNR